MYVRLLSRRVHTDLGVYIFSWETVFTMGFELDVLRGKRPYRWTIWVSHPSQLINAHHLNGRQLYLGTRYVGLASFVVFFIDTDSGKVPCHVSRIFLGKGYHHSYPFQRLIVANYVRAQHPSASLFLTDVMLH